jgi:hypothetical protein
MKIYQTLLLGGTILGLGMVGPAMAETSLNASSATNLNNAVKVDTQTDVVTDKVYNNDGEIVATNTTKTVTDTYKFDTNNNGILDEDEYVIHSYTMIDHDGDGMIDDVEWKDYNTHWYGPVGLKPRSESFTAYDLNADGYLDGTEYQQAYDADLYRAWDTDKDGVVRTSDYEAMTTTYHDLDNDGLYEWVTVE